MKNIQGTEDYVTTIAQGRVLVDFWADWCPPCKAMNPLLEKLAEVEPVTFVKVDIEDDRNREIVKAKEVMSIPTFILYEDGVEKKVHTGMFKEDEWEEIFVD